MAQDFRAQELFLARSVTLYRTIWPVINNKTEKVPGYPRKHLLQYEWATSFPLLCEQMRIFTKWHLTDIPQHPVALPNISNIYVKLYIQVSWKYWWMTPVSYTTLHYNSRNVLLRSVVLYDVIQISCKSISCIGVPTYILILCPLSYQNNRILRHKW